jgi:nucleoside-diphosphate-sugar epimerase
MNEKRGNLSKKVYLTGATGGLGREVLRETKAIPVVRSKSGLKNEVISDFSVESLRGIFKDADAVIHLTGSRDFLDRKKAFEGNVELTRKVVDATPKKAKLIFSSSISVYGKRMVEIPADEETELRPDTPYAKSELEAEKLVAKHPYNVILRIGPVYGTMFREYFKVLDRIMEGRMVILGDGKNRIPFVHVADVAKAILNAIYKGKGIYVLVGECLPQNEIYALAAKKLEVHAVPGKKLKIDIPKKSIPVSEAKERAHLGLFRTRLSGGVLLFTPEDIAVLSSDRAFNCSKAKKELGFSPRPLSEGIFEMVMYMRPVP